MMIILNHLHNPRSVETDSESKDKHSLYIFNPTGIKFDDNTEK